MSRFATNGGLVLAVSVSVLLAGGCRDQGDLAEPGGQSASQVAPRQLDPPAAEGAFAPRLVVNESELLMTWWEPLEVPEGGKRHRLVFAQYTDGWSEPSVVVEGDDMFANWADFPNVIREPSGSLLVHWLQKTAVATFAYSIYLARSRDDGATWTALGKLNDDATDTEHGFVSLVAEGDAVRAYWLDGRGMADDGPMTVRSALIGEVVGASEMVDDRVCECCPTDAVAIDGGSIVAYRDRAEDETREILSAWRRDDAFEAPQPLTTDGWKIPGCPVNGPAIDAQGEAVAVAWFTAADQSPRVSMRFAERLGGTLDLSAEAILVDGDRPLGRAGLVLDEDGSAVVSWLAVVGDEAELRLRRVTPDGGAGEPLDIARTAGSRSSGIPQLARRGETLVVSWVEILDGSPSHIRLREIPTTLVPAAETAVDG